MKEKKQVSHYCYLFASFCFFIGAVINLFHNDTQYLSVIQFFLVAVFLVLSRRKDEN
ncbi:MAG: hypothetical protein HDR21_05760 [Lachnospiraceae bacterium]|nr:hypothetical protein [Lachnospiraceae bacterium]